MNSSTETKQQLCGCGCGSLAPIVKRTSRTREYIYIKGQPLEFIVGHRNRLRRCEITRQCSVCGRSFPGWQHQEKHKRGRVCSRECQYKTVSAKLSGERVERTCLGCGQSFYVSPRYLSYPRYKGSGKYCSRPCRDAHRHGENHPSYNPDRMRIRSGARVTYYLRRKVIDRDGRKCTDCGAGYPLHIHHIVPFRRFDSASEANRLENLITVCPTCHDRRDCENGKTYGWTRASPLAEWEERFASLLD